MNSRRFNLGSSAITVTLKLAKFLHTIPHPGTAAFSFLRDGLLEFGLSWQSVSFENRSARLGDMVLKLSLFGGTVNVKILVDQVEVFIGADYTGALSQLDTVLPVIGEILREADTEARVAEVDVLMRSHFTLLDSDADVHLNRFLLPRSGASPVAFAFRIDSDSQFFAKNGQVTIARSLQIPGGLFAEWSATLSDFPELGTITSRTAGEFVRVLGLFGLVSNEEKDAA